MVFFNYSTMQMVVKIVYYGPGLCGKTTNLEYIYSKTSPKSRGEMVSLETETDRTLFFDLLPIEVGVIGGFKTRFQLYTVPGQVFYNSTRKLVLKGVDGIVFVADSQRPMLEANIESFKNLEENLADLGINIDDIPIVLQYNKRDLKNICTVEELNEALNKKGYPYVESIAITGKGVFETLKLISKYTLLSVRKKLNLEEVKKNKAVSPGVSHPVQPKNTVATKKEDREKEVVRENKENIYISEDEVEVENETTKIDETMPSKEISPSDVRESVAEEVLNERVERSSVKEETLKKEETVKEEKQPGKVIASQESKKTKKVEELITVNFDTSPAPKTEKKHKKKKAINDLDVDNLLAGLVPTKQTFIKQLGYEFNSQEFKRINGVEVVLNFKDESGKPVRAEKFFLKIDKKSKTKQALLKILVDLMS